MAQPPHIHTPSTEVVLMGMSIDLEHQLQSSIISIEALARKAQGVESLEGASSG